MPLVLFCSLTCLGFLLLWLDFSFSPHFGISSVDGESFYQKFGLGLCHGSNISVAFNNRGRFLTHENAGGGCALWSLHSGIQIEETNSVWERKEMAGACDGSYSFSLKVGHVTSTHVSLAKSNPTAKPDVAEAGGMIFLQ